MALDGHQSIILHTKQQQQQRSGVGRCRDVVRLLGSVGGYKSIVLVPIEWGVLNKLIMYTVLLIDYFINNNQPKKSEWRRKV